MTSFKSQEDKFAFTCNFLFINPNIIYTQYHRKYNETRTKINLLMYIKQSAILYFLPASAKYVLRIVYMAGHGPFWTILTFRIVHIKLHQKVAL